MEGPRLEVKSELQLGVHHSNTRSKPRRWHRPACSNARSLTHWARHPHETSGCLNMLSHTGTPANGFLKGMFHLTFSSATNNGFDFSASSQTLATVYHFDYRHSSGKKRRLTVVLIYISLVTHGVRHLLMFYWPFVCLLWRNVYSNSSLILKLS